jgi:hypothetical protein
VDLSFLGPRNRDRTVAKGMKGVGGALGRADEKFAAKFMNLFRGGINSTRVASVLVTTGMVLQTASGVYDLITLAGDVRRDQEQARRFQAGVAELHTDAAKWAELLAFGADGRPGALSTLAGHCREIEDFIARLERTATDDLAQVALLEQRIASYEGVIADAESRLSRR